jgi:Na+-translocating ferredoxin:NAD+ oxidoreductase RnfA subunit
MRILESILFGALLNNIVLCRSLGLSTMLVGDNRFSTLSRFASLAAASSLLAALIAYPVMNIAGDFAAFSFCVIIGVLAGEILRVFLRMRDEGEIFYLVGANSAVIGMLALNYGPTPSFFAFMISAAAMTVGYLAVSLVLAAALERLRMCSLLYPFSEGSCYFIVAGLFGMALMGFI